VLSESALLAEVVEATRLKCRSAVTNALEFWRYSVETLGARGRSRSTRRSDSLHTEGATLARLGLQANAAQRFDRPAKFVTWTRLTLGSL
jgi:hypothetical protein